MFQIPKIPQSVKNLVDVVKASKPILHNVFDEQYKTFSAIKKLTASCAVKLKAYDTTDYNTKQKIRLLQCLSEPIGPIPQANGNLSKVTDPEKMNDRESKEIPFMSGNWWKYHPANDGDHAMPDGKHYDVDSAVHIWDFQKSTAAATAGNLLANCSGIRYKTIVEQSLSAASKVAVDCSSFINDSLATMSKEISDTSDTLDAAMMRFVAHSFPLINIVPDTPEEKAKYNESGRLAEDIVTKCQAFGSSVRQHYDLQSATEKKLNDLFAAFLQASAFASILNDPCIQTLMSSVGTQDFCNAVGLKKIEQAFSNDADDFIFRFKDLL